MPLGGEYDDGPTVASDNAVKSSENKITGAPTGNSDDALSSSVDRSSKAVPLPDGISEMKNEPLSGAGSQNLTGEGSGKGGKDEPYVDRVAEEKEGSNQ